MSVFWHALCLSMEKLFSKNYKDIRKQVQDAFKKKS
jgi:hypothetical protein